MAITLKQLYAGGTEGNSTKIKARLDLGAVNTIENNIKVYTIQYKWPTSPGKLRLWINNELIQEVDSTGVQPYFENLLIGGDEENLEGYIYEIVALKTGFNSVLDTELQAYNNWLADKWLPTGSNFNGYTVNSTAGTEPTFTTGSNRFLAKWLHLDESTIVDDGSGLVNQWNDKAGFSGVNKVSSYYNFPTSNKLPLETTGKGGKRVVRFNRDNFFKLDVQNAGVNDPADPDYITFFIVAKFDDFDRSGGFSESQTLLGSITDAGAFNTAIRLKKYPTDNFLSLRMQIGGTFRNGQFPRNKVLDITTIEGAESANLRLAYTKDETFSTGITYTSGVTITETNKGAAIFNLTGLDYDTYYVRAEIDSVLNPHTAKFKTFRKSNPEGFSFIFGSCNNTNSNHIIWDAMKEKNPDLFFHLGDLHYEDIATPDTDLFRDAYNSTVEQPRQKDFYSNQSNYYIWDDHDYGPNNSDKDSPSRANAIEFYLSNIPYQNIITDPITNGISQYYDIGRCRFVMTDLRANRDDWMIEPYTDPNKTVLGTATKNWFKNLLLDYKNNNNLDVLFWMNPFGWTGDETDPYSWSYNVTTETWSVYLSERQELANYMYYNNISNVVICNGDTHMIAIDDGRNNFYATDNSGNRIKASNVPANLQHLIIESSPFDRDGDKQGGLFQIDDLDNSGGPFPVGNNNFSFITVNDLGSNWIEVIIQQYGYFQFFEGGNELYLIREFKKQYRTKRSINSIPPPPPFVSSNKVGFGVVTLPEEDHPIQNSLIQIDSPIPLLNTYKGVITGRVINFDVSGGGIVAELYRRSDQDYFVTLGAVNSTTGTFTLTPPNNQSGTIIIKLKDTEFNFTFFEFVNDENNPNYHNNLSIERWVTTDIDYFSGQAINVPEGKEFKLPFSLTEGKVKFKLKRTTDNVYVAESPFKTDLARSFLIDDNDPEVISSPFPSRSYLYDMALVLISSTGLKDFKFADRIVSGIIESQYANGAFAFSVNHINPRPELQDPYFRTGAIGWVAYALGYYLQYRRNSPLKSEAENALVKVLDYIESLESNPIGLPTGGKGRYYLEGGLELFDPDYIIPWISTEHCIDYFFALKQAGRVLNDSTYTAKSNQVKNLMINQLWDSTNNRFFQGISNAATNTKDTADALDCNSWGALMLFSAGETEKANQLLPRLENFYYVEDTITGAKGYKPYSDQWGYPGAAATVWFEGSFGVALAYWRAKQYEKYSEIMNDLKEFEEPDGSYRYAALRDEVYQISNYPSTCSTSWYIIAARLKNSVWI
ncbi:alkaline phosphatase D family protein [Algoriphagus sp. AK58]|uniref:alkaline phosphatase D family protein n=1 Tax=Algoriphagus sp. AK58 TaxID=1406877 RepID=UPI0016504272|nr:alkaline phosphatase D family protein [Algoriphagus sp. AK58]MBC6365801.1 hypothetical protein [Algoriphagus sp. AK58]